MTPTRACEIADGIAWSDATRTIIAEAILAACAEERRAALTEAATVVCCDVAKYGSMEHTCRGNVLALRDREPR